MNKFIRAAREINTVGKVLIIAVLASSTGALFFDATKNCRNCTPDWGVVVLMTGLAVLVPYFVLFGFGKNPGK